MHILEPLPYSHTALEPYIDAKTMEIHHSKHHAAYVDKLNKSLEAYPELQTLPIEALIKIIREKKEISEKDRQAIINFGGGHSNHVLFWQFMNPENKKNQNLVNDIAQTFGSVDTFKTEFSALAQSLFGSGWVWLVRDREQKLMMYGTPNQDSPLLQGHTPELCIDLWEHAYYLNYQNRRADYITAWWNTIKFI